MAKKKKAVKDPNFVERSIYFYKVVFLPEEPTPSIDWPRLCERISGLSAANKYWTDRFGNETSCWIDSSNPVKIRYGSIRRRGLPQVERLGNLSPLGIPPDSSLVDMIHVRVFQEGDTAIVGSDFNFHGPRMSRLAHYLNEKDNSIPTFGFQPILKQDAVERLERLDGLRLFRLRINKTFVDAVKRANESLGASFEAQAELGDADEIEVVLTVKRYSRSTFLSRTLQTITRRLLGNRDLPGNATAFEVAGFNATEDKSETIDLLSANFVVKKDFIKESEKSRALKPRAAFTSIEDAYNELRDELVSSIR